MSYEESSNVDDKNSKLISVIMPVYNGEPYLDRTIQSLRHQSYKNFELIVVDDSSTDSSLDILRKHEQEDRRIKVYVKENGGSAVKSIKFGLNYTSGDFMFYTSQDDLFSNDLFEKMLTKAVQTGADAVVPDMVLYNELSSENDELCGVHGNRDIELSGKPACILSLNWDVHGFSLRKMELVKKVGFQDFSMNSDEYTTREFYYNCKKVVFSKGRFYYRQDNINAITKKVSVKTFDLIVTNLWLIKFLKLHNLEHQYKYYFAKSLRGLVGKTFLFLISSSKLGFSGTFKAFKLVVYGWKEMLTLIWQNKDKLSIISCVFNKNKYRPSIFIENR